MIGLSAAAIVFKDGEIPARFEVFEVAAHDVVAPVKKIIDAQADGIEEGDQLLVDVFLQVDEMGPTVMVSRITQHVSFARGDDGVPLLAMLAVQFAHPFFPFGMLQDEFFQRMLTVALHLQGDLVQKTGDDAFRIAGMTDIKDTHFHGIVHHALNNILYRHPLMVMLQFFKVVYFPEEDALPADLGLHDQGKFDPVLLNAFYHGGEGFGRQHIAGGGIEFGGQQVVHFFFGLPIHSAECEFGITGSEEPNGARPEYIP